MFDQDDQAAMRTPIKPIRPSGMQLKASSFRSYVSQLTRQGWRDAVIAAVPAETAGLIRDPPLAGSWMDLMHILFITEAVETIAGLPAVRELALKGTEDARRPYMGIIESVLKIFDTSPATLFKRMNPLVSSFIKGVDYRYTPVSDRSCVMEVRYLTDYEIPLSVFISGIPTFQALLDACGAKGLIGQPERLSASSARYRVQW
jgi:hypothetical protein